jgi:4-hydroxy-tetrahydrodipicolinate synthase
VKSLIAKGSIVALVTPMFESGAIDWETLEALVEWHVASGTKGVVPVGTTGESPTVTADENCEIIRFVVERTAGRMSVIAGTGANSTSEAIEFTASAKKSGADACLLVTPYYNKPTQAGLVAHYSAIAAAVDLPQVLYNVPGRTSCDLLPVTVAQLMSVPQVIAIKEATGSLERAREIRERCGDRIAIYSGDDETSCDLMLEGAAGTISVTANVAPEAMAEMADAAVAGDEARARQLDAPLQALHKHLFVESNPIPVKWALGYMKRIPSGIRLPLTLLSEQFHADVVAALREAGVVN